MEKPSDFFFKTIDKEGFETLDVISEADNFNDWMYNTIKQYCKGKTLEIGSGLGNISSYFIKDNFNIFLSDIRDNYCDELKRKFSTNNNVIGIENIDLVDPDFDTKYAQHLNSFDTVFALNVIEHIEDDTLAIKNCKKLLSKGGSLIILVPAYQKLYNAFDKALYHYRRYTSKQMENIFFENEITIRKSFYFNFLGIFGWYISGQIMHKKLITKSQMNFYNKIVFIAKILDTISLKKIGLSSIVIGEKK
jgi:SAM-dependent methyltransferase